MTETPNPALGERIRAAELSAAMAEFIVAARFEDLPTQAVEAAKIFFIDTLACGVAGRGYEASDLVLAAASKWGQGDVARIIGRPGVKLPPPAAAMVNGYQIHALEWDGLHEYSVVIALGAPTAALLAEAEQRPLSGQALLTALCVAIDVAVFFGAASSSAPKFFRPAIAGQMGAVAALAVARGYDEATTLNALGLAYSHLSGTMQAHWEGSMALALQVGQAARAAHQAADLAEAGFSGPVDIIGGQFGYFTLFEEPGDVAGELGRLGNPWKMPEMAHKPFPAGRATQAVLTMLYELQAQTPFDWREVERLDVYAPSLILLLVGRPLTETMTPAYARLCLDFVAPLMLIDGKVDPLRFVSEVFADPDIASLSQKVCLIDDGNPDPNALGPQRCELTLTGGRTLSASCVHPLGAPGYPLDADGRRRKVQACVAAGKSQIQIDAFMEAAMAIDAADDISRLLDFIC